MNTQNIIYAFAGAVFLGFWSWVGFRPRKLFIEELKKFKLTHPCIIYFDHEEWGTACGEATYEGKRVRFISRPVNEGRGVYVTIMDSRGQPLYEGSVHA